MTFSWLPDKWKSQNVYTVHSSAYILENLFLDSWWKTSALKDLIFINSLRSLHDPFLSESSSIAIPNSSQIHPQLPTISQLLIIYFLIT